MLPSLRSVRSSRPGVLHLNNVGDLFLETDPDFETANDYANLVKVYGFWNMHALIEGQLERLLNHPLLEVMVTKRRIEDPLGLEWRPAEAGDQASHGASRIALARA